MTASEEDRLDVGDHVKVKPGVTDVMSSDIHLDGWTGVVGQVDEDMIKVHWDKKTLERMPVSYRQHWELDALPWESLWLPRKALTPL